MLFDLHNFDFLPQHESFFPCQEFLFFIYETLCVNRVEFISMQIIQITRKFDAVL